MIEIAVAIISALAVVAAAVVAVWGKRIDQKFDELTTELVSLTSTVGRVREQVENSHSTNLREELDARHEETREWFSDTKDDLSEVRRDVGGIRSEVRNLHRRDSALDERIQRVESTAIQIIRNQEKNR